MHNKLVSLGRKTIP